MEFLLIDFGVAVAGLLAYRSLVLLRERRIPVIAVRRPASARGSQNRPS